MQGRGKGNADACNHVTIVNAELGLIKREMPREHSSDKSGEGDFFLPRQDVYFEATCLGVPVD